MVLYGAAQRAGWQVVHCARAAVAMGVRPGMPLAEAQTLLERPVLRASGPPPRGGRGTGVRPAVSRAIHFAQHDPQADRKLLQLLAGWCMRYSPLVGLEQTDQPSALFLDIMGCAHLFGGEERMAVQIVGDFERAGYAVRVAVADTLGSAWAVVRYGDCHTACDVSRLISRHTLYAQDSTQSVSATRPMIVPTGAQSIWLRDLPVAALRLPENVIETLHELGLRQIGSLQNLPRSSLPARFGPCILERLDQALGLTEELIVSVPSSEPIEADWSFEEPTADRRALEAALQRLIGEIAETLAARREGAQQLVCRLLCAGKEPVWLTVGTLHPTATVEHLCELIGLQLERITLAGEIGSVHVEVAARGPLESQQQKFFTAGVKREGERQLAVLLDRFSSRLGEKAVLRPRLRPDSQPEYASRLEPVMSRSRLPANTGAVNSHVQSATFNLRCLTPVPSLPVSPDDSVPDYQFVATPSARPLCLKARPISIEVVSVVPDGPPIRFRWHVAEHVIRHSWGPERIETGWWRAPHVQRDYYRVETATGQRFWLFRQNDTRRWFLHGAFE